MTCWFKIRNSNDVVVFNCLKRAKHHIMTMDFDVLNWMLGVVDVELEGRLLCYYGFKQFVIGENDLIAFGGCDCRT